MFPPTLPPFLVFGLTAVAGFAAALALIATARGEAGAFLRTPMRALLAVGLGLSANYLLFLHAVPRIGASDRTTPRSFDRSRRGWSMYRFHDEQPSRI